MKHMLKLGLLLVCIVSLGGGVIACGDDGGARTGGGSTVASTCAKLCETSPKLENCDGVDMAPLIASCKQNCATYVESADCAAKIQPYIDAGAKTMMLGPAWPDVAQITRIAKEVLPLLK
mgnify:CR=1 FL=1